MDCHLVDFGLSFGGVSFDRFWSYFWEVLECLLVECLLGNSGVSLLYYNSGKKNLEQKRK